MDISKYKGLKEIVDDIVELNNLSKSFDRHRLEKLLLKLQNKFFVKSITYERASSVISGGNITSIDQISDSTLKAKIPYYKNLCLQDLKDKYGEIVYEDLVKEYGLEA